MTSRSRLSVNLLAGLVLVVCGPGHGAGPGGKGARPSRTVKATGTVMPEEVIDVGAQVGGRVVAFGKDPDGRKTIDFRSRVEPGTVLARIDETRYARAVAIARADVGVAQAEVECAEAEAALARARAKRAKDRELAGLEVKVAEANLLRARGRVERARKVLAGAEQELSYCTICSPIKGMILDRRVNLGQTVSPSLSAPALFLIARDLKRLQVWASVKEADIADIHKGQKASITVAAHPKKVFTGQVTQVRLNATRTKDEVIYTVVIEVRNDELLLLPYLSAEVQIDVGGRD
jgi:HlyD family secretion protein